MKVFKKIFNILCLILLIIIIIYDLYNINYHDLSFKTNKQYFTSLFLMIIIGPKYLKMVINDWKKKSTNPNQTVSSTRPNLD